MESWSIGVMGFRITHHSRTPTLSIGSETMLKIAVAIEEISDEAE